MFDFFTLQLFFYLKKNADFLTIRCIIKSLRTIEYYFSFNINTCIYFISNYTLLFLVTIKIGGAVVLSKSFFTHGNKFPSKTLRWAIPLYSQMVNLKFWQFFYIKLRKGCAFKVILINI